MCGCGASTWGRRSRWSARGGHRRERGKRRRWRHLEVLVDLLVVGLGHVLRDGLDEEGEIEAGDLIGLEVAEEELGLVERLGAALGHVQRLGDVVHRVEEAAGEPLRGDREPIGRARAVERDGHHARQKLLIERDLLLACVALGELDQALLAEQAPLRHRLNERDPRGRLLIDHARVGTRHVGVGRRDRLNIGLDDLLGAHGRVEDVDRRRPVVDVRLRIREGVLGPREYLELVLGVCALAQDHDAVVDELGVVDALVLQLPEHRLQVGDDLHLALAGEREHVGHGRADDEGDVAVRERGRLVADHAVAVRDHGQVEPVLGELPALEDLDAVVHLTAARRLLEVRGGPADVVDVGVDAEPLHAAQAGERLVGARKHIAGVAHRGGGRIPHEVARIPGPKARPLALVDRLLLGLLEAALEEGDEGALAQHPALVVPGHLGDRDAADQGLLDELLLAPIPAVLLALE